MLKPVAMNRLTAKIPESVSSNCVEALLKNSQIIKHKAKATIIAAGDEGDSVYLLLDGTASVSIIDEDGKEMIVSSVNAGEFVGELGIFDTSDRKRTAWVKAKSECTVARVAYKKFEELAFEEPGVLFLVGSQLVHRLKATTKKLGDLAFMEVAGRISRCLMDLCEEDDAMTHPDGKQIKISRQEIGLRVGCTREMAGKVLKNLEEQGLVEVSGKTIVVFN